MAVSEGLRDWQDARDAVATLGLVLSQRGSIGAAEQQLFWIDQAAEALKKIMPAIASAAIADAQDALARETASQAFWATLARPGAPQ